MKKAIKKLMAAMLAVAMLCAMAVPAFAAVDLSNHTFKAYQIFSGKFEDEKLSNVQWGSGVVGNELLAELQKETAFATCDSAEKVADALTGYTETSSELKKFEEIVAKNLNENNAVTGTGSLDLDAGYYLIVDTTDVADKDDAKNLTLLKVTNATNVTPQVKTDKPTVEKKVKDTDDTTDTTTDWQDSADYDIGDTIPYQLTATMGDLSKFDTYYVEFVDTMTHLTYTGITSVEVGSTKLTASEYHVTWDKASKKLKVSIDNVKKYSATKGTTIVVEYTATLDSDANIGATGNPNTVYLRYSNNPNGTGYGQTAPDENIVFTYRLKIDKVDQDENPLKGAAFELLKKDKDDNWNSIEVLNATKDSEGNYVVDPSSTMTEFVWNGLDAGEYKIVEVVTPSSYNSIKPIEFTITANHEIEAEHPTLTELTTTSSEMSPNKDTGVISATIKNKMGSTLPETGGIGTTIFYVVGGGLMVAAVILLITKKRMEKNN